MYVCMYVCIYVYIYIYIYIERERERERERYYKMDSTGGEQLGNKETSLFTGLGRLRLEPHGMGNRVPWAKHAVCASGVRVHGWKQTD